MTNDPIIAKSFSRHLYMNDATFNRLVQYMLQLLKSASIPPMWLGLAASMATDMYMEHKIEEELRWMKELEEKKPESK